MIGMRTIGACLLALPALFLVGCQGARPADLGARNGRLAPCPDTPNCVSSQAADDGHRVAPLPYTGSREEAIARLAAAVRSFPRAGIVTGTDGYLRAEFTSVLFRFVDDVEFLADDDAKVIHIRSASRIGRSDLGVNRKRVEAVRAKWTAPAR